MCADEGDEGIKVTDRRRFTSEGASRPEGESEAAKAPPPPAEPAASAPAAAAPQADREFPPIDFATFILSLATSAQVHLGLLANPATGKEEPALPLAKETIDLLGMLQEKTKGNLTADEERLFDHILYDLRMMYVEQSKQGQQSGV